MCVIMFVVSGGGPMTLVVQGHILMFTSGNRDIMRGGQGQSTKIGGSVQTMKKSQS